MMISYDQLPGLGDISAAITAPSGSANQLEATVSTPEKRAGICPPSFCRGIMARGLVYPPVLWEEGDGTVYPLVPKGTVGLALLMVSQLIFWLRVLLIGNDIEIWCRDQVDLYATLCQVQRPLFTQLVSPSTHMRDYRALSRSFALT
ncbi:hypothetical protein V8C26DRAFT_356503 [Trichoderma gracile]